MSERRLKEIAQALQRSCTMTAKEALEEMKKGILGMPQFTQQMIDSVAAMQEDWPMPAQGWGLFVRDIQRTNTKYGWNLRVPETPGHLTEVTE